MVVGLIAHPLIYGKIKKEYPNEAKEDEEAEKNAGRWLTIVVGLVETTAFFLFFIFEVSAVGAFVAGWIAIKMATGWHRFARATESRYYPRMGFGALTLNLLNVLFALIGAQVFYRLLGG